MLIRRIAATLAGLLAGAATVGMIEWLSSLLHPMPSDLDMQDPDALQAWIQELPASAMLAVLLAWAVGSAVGASVARRLAPGRSLLPAGVVIGVLFLATLLNLIALPHPLWMWPAGLLAIMLGGTLGCLWAAPPSYTLATTRVLRAPRDKVFGTLARVEHFSQAVPHITAIEFLTDKKYGVGTRFRETRNLNGREATTVLEVTELSENERVRLVSDAGGTRWDTLFAVAPSSAAEPACQLQLTMHAIPQTWAAKLMVPLILGVVGQAVESDMDAVQAYCEAESKP